MPSRRALKYPKNIRITSHKSCQKDAIENFVRLKESSFCLCPEVGRAVFREILTRSHVRCRAKSHGCFLPGWIKPNITKGQPQTHGRLENRFFGFTNKVWWCLIKKRYQNKEPWKRLESHFERSISRVISWSFIISRIITKPVPWVQLGMALRKLI